MNDPQQLLTALTTEHFTLQGARSQTMSEPIFAFSSAIAVINGVIGGATAALALGALADASLGVATLAGAAVAVALVVGWIRYADVLLDQRAAEVQPIFPSRGTQTRPDSGRWKER